MGEICSWNPTYSVNVDALDAQHKNLFRLFNELGGQITDQTVLRRVLDELVNYTKSHFSAEEALMEKHQFPARGVHKVEHVNFIHQLHAFQSDFAAGKVCVSSSLLLFLSNWLSNHILKIDRQYSVFFNSRGLY